MTPTDIKTLSNGNWAYLQLREAVNFLYCYERSQWDFHGGSDPMPPEQGGARLYQAKIHLYEAMRGEEYLYQWFDRKLYESGGPPQPLQFFEWRWTCVDDVKATFRDVLMRIDRPLTQNLKSLLKVQQKTDQGAEKALKDMRVALEIESRALHRGQNNPHEPAEFLKDLIIFLATAFNEGRHRNGILQHSALTEIRDQLADKRGIKPEKAKRMWLKAKPGIDGLIVKFSNDKRFVMRVDDRGKVRFEII